MKVVVNRCYGGFDLSVKAIKRYLELKALPCYFYKQTKFKFNDGVNEHKVLNSYEDCELPVYISTKYFGEVINIDKISSEDYREHFFYSDNVKRNDPVLIQVIEELGSEADSEYSNLEIVEIPDDVDFEISEYDGVERIHEKHRTW